MAILVVATRRHRRAGSRRKDEDEDDIELYDGFFERAVDRSEVYTVKHGLAGAIFGPAAAAPGTIPMWVADMDLPCAPAIVRALRRRCEHPTFGYTFQPSDMWVVVQRWLLHEHGWDVPAEAFVWCPSVVTATAATLWAFTSPGDAVLVMTPLYQPLQAAVAASGRVLRCHALEMTGGAYRLDAARFHEDLKGCKALLFCNPHNPGGRVWTHEELDFVLEACNQEGVFIITDEIWADWCLFGKRYRPLALEARVRTVTTSAEACGIITLMAPTKTWNLAGLHCSYLIIEDTALRERYLTTVAYAFLHYGNTFGTEAMLAAYSSGGPWLRRAKQHVESQLRRSEAFLQEYCAPEVVPYLPEATYLIWLDCAGLQLEDPAKYLLEDAGVVVSPGSEFGGEATAQFVRLNVACSRATLQKALQKIAGAVARRRKGLGPGEHRA